MTKKNNFTLYEVIISFFVITAAMFIIVSLLSTGIHNIEESRNQLYPRAGMRILEPYLQSYVRSSSNWNVASSSSPADLANIPYKTFSTDMTSAAAITTFETALKGESDWKTAKLEQKSGTAVLTAADNSFQVKSQGKGVHSLSFITTTSRGQVKRNFGLTCWYESTAKVFTTTGEITTADVPSFVKVHYLISWPTTISFEQRITNGNYIYNSFIVTKE